MYSVHSLVRRLALKSRELSYYEYMYKYINKLIYIVKHEFK